MQTNQGSKSSRDKYLTTIHHNKNSKYKILALLFPYHHIDPYTQRLACLKGAMNKVLKIRTASIVIYFLLISCHYLVLKLN